MSEPDYKVFYKSRGTPQDSARPDRDRRARAAEPYDDGDISWIGPRRERDSSSTIDTASTVTTSRLKRGTYSAQERSRDLKSEQSARPSQSVVEDRERGSRKTIVLDQEFSATRSPRASGALQGRPQQRSHASVDIEVDRRRDRRTDYMVDDNVRRDDNAYVMDTRGDIDIIMPGRDRPQDDDRRGPRYVYRNASPVEKQQYYDEHPYREGDTLPGGIVVLRRDITPPFQSRSQYRSDDRPRGREYEEDDEWRIVDTMRDTHVSSAQPRQSRTRSRAPTQSSEDSFVMVSPRTPQPEPGLRSAMRHTDYEPRELRRRRSRSISFREKEVAHHDASERYHQPPGAEASECGRYLAERSEDKEYDLYDRRRMSEAGHRDDRKRQRGDDGVVNSTYDEERVWMPYPPQQDRSSRRRSRSRRRQREDDDKDSYFSEHKFYKKESRYL